MLQNVKKPSGWFGGPKPSKCNPNPATCVADSEALLCKVSLRYLPPVRLKGREGNSVHIRKRTPQADFFDN